MAMYGVTPTQASYAGQAWFFGTDALNNIRTTLEIHSKQNIALLFSNYEILFNIMDDRNKLARRWVEWMGFEFLWKMPEHGHQKLPFWFFAKCLDAESARKHSGLFDKIRREEP